MARRTTLAGAAAEVERGLRRSEPAKSGIPVVPALAVAAGIAAIVIVGLFAALRRPAPAPAAPQPRDRVGPSPCLSSSAPRDEDREIGGGTEKTRSAASQLNTTRGRDREW